MLNSVWRMASPLLLATAVALVVVSIGLVPIEDRRILAVTAGAVAFVAVYRWARASQRHEDLSAELAGLI
ncbi:MAG: hypothetical protein EHM57_08220, partial [Actinobacteria bacterium]